MRMLFSKLIKCLQQQVFLQSQMTADCAWMLSVEIQEYSLLGGLEFTEMMKPISAKF